MIQLITLAILLPFQATGNDKRGCRAPAVPLPECSFHLHDSSQVLLWGNLTYFKWLTESWRWLFKFRDRSDETKMLSCTYLYCERILSDRWQCLAQGIMVVQCKITMHMNGAQCFWAPLDVHSAWTFLILVELWTPDQSHLPLRGETCKMTDV